MVAQLSLGLLATLNVLVGALVLIARRNGKGQSYRR